MLLENTHAGRAPARTIIAASLLAGDFARLQGRCGDQPGNARGAVAPVLDLVDIVLVMTVDPGFGGQSFLASSIAKIVAVREMMAASGRTIALAVYGGITRKAAASVRAAGATVLVAGTAVFEVFDAPDYAAAVTALKGAAAEAGA